MNAPARRYRTPCGSTVEVDTDFSLHAYACVRRDDEALRSAVRQEHALELPPPGRAVSAGGVTLMHAAPRRLLVEGGALAAAGRADLQATDIGDGLVRLRGRGRSLRAWLGRFMPLDMRRGALAAGRVTWSEFLELRTLLHCLDDERFDLYLPASCLDDVVASAIAFGALEPVAQPQA